MKKMLLLVLCLLLATAAAGCTADLGVIGGADGPTVIVVGTPGDESPSE